MNGSFSQIHSGAIIDYGLTLNYRDASFIGYFFRYWLIDNRIMTLKEA
jgi:hypothetical protein